MAFDLDEDELKATRKMNKADRNEIEVGEYVKTENGIIDKVDALYGMIENTVYLKQQSLWFNADYIVKHSKQLIDLIEIGDILELREYVDYFKKSEKIGISDMDMLSNIKQAIRDKKIEVLSILTKEQYMANCYKVGGEENEASND